MTAPLQTQQDFLSSNSSRTNKPGSDRQGLLKSAQHHILCSLIFQGFSINSGSVHPCPLPKSSCPMFPPRVVIRYLEQGGELHRRSGAISSRETGSDRRILTSDSSGMSVNYRRGAGAIASSISITGSSQISHVKQRK